VRGAVAATLLSAADTERSGEKRTCTSGLKVRNFNCTGHITFDKFGRMKTKYFVFSTDSIEYLLYLSIFNTILFISTGIYIITVTFIQGCHWGGGLLQMPHSKKF
jgi:hypothetical protein